MRTLFTLFRKDLLLGIKDIFVLLEVGFAAAMAAALVFVVPEEIDTEGLAFIHDSSGTLERFVDAAVAEAGIEGGAEAVGETFVDSRAAVIDGMVEHRNAVGIVVEGGEDGRLHVDLLTQPYTTPALVSYIEAEMRDFFAILGSGPGAYPPPVYRTVRLEALETGVRDAIPFNDQLVPVVLFMMVGIVGLFAMVSLLGQERDDKTIRATRVSPTGLAAVITSKHLVLLATGFTTFSIIYLATIGVTGYLPALGIMLLTVLVGSSIGAILGAFFANPMNAMLWVFAILIILGLPAVSLFAPVFSPWWMRILPSYHTLFGLDAAMFPGGEAGTIGRSVLVLVGWAAALVPLSGWIFAARTRKEA